MFQDEARFGRISDTRYCWCRRPDRPLVSAMVTQQYTYAYGAVSPQDGCFDSLVLPQVNSECMQIFLDEIASRHLNDNVVMVLDGAGWHKSKDFRLPDNLRLLFLPPYSPELNPQELIPGLSAGQMPLFPEFRRGQPPSGCPVLSTVRLRHEPEFPVLRRRR